jgi:membrane fusion protein (multidrug efflux system)
MITYGVVRDKEADRMSRPPETGQGLLKLWLLLTAAVLCACAAEEPPPTAPPEIAVVKVIARDTLITQDFVGQTLGSTDIPIRARVEGFLESRNFIEGREVEEGQLLYTIEQRPYLAKVVEAEGRLAESRTMLAKARADLARIEPLAKMKAVSKQDLDASVAERDAAMGAVQATEAQLELANIELGYAEIHSPINGYIGISQAQVGEFVGSPPNPVVLNYVSLTDPIRVRFSINERDFLRLSREVSRRRHLDEQAATPRMEVELILADGSIHSHKGTIVASDAAMNPDTGTFTLEADFANPDSIVIAGQFARARIAIDRLHGALLIPQRAVAELQGNFRVFAVAEDGTVKLKTVQLGPQVGRMMVVESGLEAGEQIAIEGLLSLQNGDTVQPRLTSFDESAATDSDPKD